MNSALLTEKDLRRFDAFIYPDPNSGCFLWGGSEIGRNRYACFTVKGKACAAHRLAWAMANGPIPKGRQVLHKCDTPCCVNPDHLFLGNHVINMADMARKRRGKPSKKGLPRGVLLVRSRFRAAVSHQGKGVHVGYFDTVEEAAAAAEAQREARP